MGVFHIFKIVPMVSDHIKLLICSSSRLDFIVDGCTVRIMLILFDTLILQIIVASILIEICELFRPKVAYFIKVLFQAFLFGDLIEFRFADFFARNNSPIA